MIYLRGNATDLRAGSWEQSTISKSHPSPFDKLCQRTSISTISEEHFRLGKSTCKSLYNRYCAFRIMDICWMNHRCHRKSKRISTTICFFLSLIFLPPSIPHSLPFWWEVRTLLWVYDTKTRRFSANRIFEPNLLANTSALQRLLFISNFENKSRLFVTEWQSLGSIRHWHPVFVMYSRVYKIPRRIFFGVFPVVQIDFSYFSTVYRSGWLGILSSLWYCQP